MTIDGFGNIDIAIVVSLSALRTLLKGFLVNGSRWWIASHPDDAREDGSITLGFGEPSCCDPLNRAFFRIPILETTVADDTDGVLLLFHPCAILSEDIEAFPEFYPPLKQALLARLQNGGHA